MILGRLNEREAETFKLEIDSQERKLLEALKNGEYSIQFKVDIENLSISYLAIRKRVREDNLPETIQFTIDVYQKILSHSQCVHLRSYETLMYFLYMREKKCSERKLIEIYGEEAKELLAYSNMSEADREAQKQGLEAIEKLFSEIRTDAKEKVLVEKKLELICQLGPKPNNGVKIQLFLCSDDIEIKLSDLKDVFCAVSGQPIKTENTIYEFAEGVLSQKQRDVLNYLLNLNIQVQGVYFELFADQAPFFFHLMKGVGTFKKNKKTMVLYVSKPKISVDDDGRVKADIPPMKEIYFQDLYALGFADCDEMPFLFEFDTLKERTLCEFAINYQNFDYSLIKDKMREEVLPYVSNVVEVSCKFLEENPIHVGSIKYYIDYDEDKQKVCFSTLYHIDDIQVSKREFDQFKGAYHRWVDFKNELNYWNLPEREEEEVDVALSKIVNVDFTILKRYAEVYVSDNLTKVIKAGRNEMSIVIKTHLDWFEMKVKSSQFTDDELITVLNAIAHKKRFVKLKKSFVQLDHVNDLRDLINEYHLTEEEKLPNYMMFGLAELADSIGCQYSEEARNLLKSIRDFKDKEVCLDRDILNVLRPYQLDAVRWLSALKDHNLSGILADDMGLGKTLEVIAMLSLDKESGPVLIVTPKSLIYNWAKEFNMWHPEQEYIVLDMDQQSRRALIRDIQSDKKVVYIISYDTLKNDLDHFKKKRFSYMILDEGQNIANSAAKRSAAVKMIRADHRFVLTGTPIQNSLLDLWSIFEFLMPGYLENKTNFHSKYATYHLDPVLREKLQRKIAPFILKRTKDEVLTDLPSKEEIILPIGMNQEQQRIYDAYLINARNELDENRLSQLSVLTALMRLRQVCVDPSSFLEDYKAPAEKMDAAIDMIKQAISSGHKILVFSSFAKVLFHLQKMLEEEGVVNRMIYGQTPAQERLELAENFNTKDDVKVMLVSLKAGGTGLNLIGADIVIHMDPWWNIAAEDQASDRAYRIGQTRPVTIYKLICKNSIEEKVIELQRMKSELASVIRDGEDGITGMTDEDIRFILS